MFLATIVYDLLFLLIVQISGSPVAWLDSLVRIILPSAVLNAVLTPLVFVVDALACTLGSAAKRWSGRLTELAGRRAIETQTGRRFGA